MRAGYSCWLLYSKGLACYRDCFRLFWSMGSYHIVTVWLGNKVGMGEEIFFFFFGITVTTMIRIFFANNDNTLNDIESK